MQRTVALWQVVIATITVTAFMMLGGWRMQAVSEARNDARIDAVRAELAATRAELRADIHASRAELSARIDAVNQRFDALLQVLAGRGAGDE